MPWFSSKRWFDALDPETRKILVDTARETTVLQREETARREAGYVAVIKASSTTLTTLPADSRGAFEAATRPVHDKFRSSIGTELLDKTYRKIKQLSGF